MKVRLALSTAILCLNGLAQIGMAPKHDFTLQPATDPKFHPGDRWEYDTRPGERKSTAIILKVENSPELGVIVHIAVDNLVWVSCQNDHIPEREPHMPFSRDAVDASLTRRIASNQPAPDRAKEGYIQWKEAWPRRQAGIYVIPVREAVAVAEATYRSANGCK